MAFAKRELGYTEANWCLALDGGTGVTVSAFLFAAPLSKSTVQAAVTELICALPFLSTQIVSEDTKLFFQISDSPVPVEEYGNPFEGETEHDKAEEAAEIWLRIVDLEMNSLFPLTRPTPILQVHLYKDIPHNSSLVVLRTHSAAADMASAGSLGPAFLNTLKGFVKKSKAGESIEELLEKVKLEESCLEEFEYYPPIEKAIPKGGASKPFWAHGTDVIGYGLVSRRHAYLPFNDTTSERKSRLIRASLSKEATDCLIKACEDKSSNLYGALSAAVLKSVAAFKKTGQRGEHYGFAVLYNCRAVLDPKLSDDALGFYHSALLKTTHTTEDHEFWKMASQLTKDFQESIKNRKHFTDMGNLNMLMVQAIHHPHLTPSSTLRTAMCSILHDAYIETTPMEAAEVLKLKDFVSTSSCQGVGPCLGIFHSLRDGALHLQFVYCTPLFKRHDIQIIVDSVMDYIDV